MCASLGMQPFFLIITSFMLSLSMTQYKLFLFIFVRIIVAILISLHLICYSVQKYPAVILVGTVLICRLIWRKLTL